MAFKGRELAWHWAAAACKLVNLQPWEEFLKLEALLFVHEDSALLLEHLGASPLGPPALGGLHVDLDRIGAPPRAARHDPREPDVLPAHTVVNHDERAEAQTRGSKKEAKNQVQRVVQRNSQGPRHPQGDIQEQGEAGPQKLGVESVLVLQG